MDYRTITDTSSKQYEVVNDANIQYGLLYYQGYLCVAMGSVYGPIGSIYKITFETGNQITVIKADEKSDSHTVNGCNNTNGSILELIVDTRTIDSYVQQTGDYNNSSLLYGKIIKIEELS